MREHIKLLIAVCLSAFLTAFMGVSLIIAMPYIAQEYNTAPENVTWMINAFTATSASSLLLASSLADRFSYLRIFLIGAFLSALFSFGVALSYNIVMASIFRGLQGISLALVFCTSMALISKHIEGKSRSYAIGYYVASVYSGLSFSPIVSGLIVDTIGWQFMFYFTGLGMLIATYLATKEQKDHAINNKLPHIKMYLSFIIGMLILLGISSYTTQLWMLYVLILGIILLIISLYLEYKSPKPLLPLHFICHNKILLYALLAALFQYFGSFVFILLIGMHLQLILGYGAIETGLILLIQPILMVIFSSLSGKLTHHIGSQNMTLIGMLLGLSSFILLLTLEPKSSLAIIILAQILLGIGFGLFSAPNTVIIMNSVESSKYALAAALQSISRSSGQALSMAVASAIMHYFISAEPKTTLYIWELSYAHHLIYIVSTCAFILAFIACFLSRHYRIKSLHLSS